MNVICPRCGVIERTVAQQIGGKTTFGLAAAALGTRCRVGKNSFLRFVCYSISFLFAFQTPPMK
jgi:hypothetical protein